MCVCFEDDIVGHVKQEARALLGRLEYERGNYEAALEVLEGVQGHTFGATLRFFIADFKTRQAKKGSRQSSKEGSNSGKDNTVLGTFLHGASLLLEALYLKAKCLQELDQLPGLINSSLSFSRYILIKKQTYMNTHSSNSEN